MTLAVLGAPVVVVVPDIDAGWEKIQVTWDGWDGSHWDLTVPEQGVFIARGGVRGLGMPKFQHYRDQSPAVAGSYWRGMFYDSREVFWPLYLFSDESTQAYIELDRAFWKSLHPEHEGTLTVRIPGSGVRRSLKLRLQDDGNWSPDIDPTFYGWSSYGVTLQADQPFWEGVKQELPWTSTVPVPFFGGTGVITISSGRALSSATITNIGDVEAYPIWKVVGPTDVAGAIISVDGRAIEVPILLGVGDYVTINTKPTEQTAIKNGTIDVFDQLGQVNFAPIPAGNTANLALTMSGTGTIEVELTPLYLRAW